MKRRVMTLCLVQKGDEILLGMKKIGFGKGNWNGFGGKVEVGEGIEEAAIRELKEECGLVAKNIYKGGINEFEFIEDNELHEVHIFYANEFNGEPIESDEMIPKWFNKNEIPFNEMWPDDKEWIPLLLSGKKFKGRFAFNKLNEITDSELLEVDEL